MLKKSCKNGHFGFIFCLITRIIAIYKMNKIGNDKTHLDIEENRLKVYSMTFRMRYERLFIPIDTY